MTLVLVAGPGFTLGDDMARVQKICGNIGTVVSVKQATRFLPVVSAAAYLHPEQVDRDLAARRNADLPCDFPVYCHTARPAHGCDPVRTPVITRFGDWSGSSGLFAVRIALEALGASHVLLAGVPMEPGGYDERSGKSGEMDRVTMYHRGWIAKANRIAGAVRSMSGWTRSFLGGPDDQWLQEALA